MPLRHCLPLVPLVILAILLSACSHSRTKHGDEPVDAVPSGTTAVAGIDLNTLRRSPLYPFMPAAVRSLAESVTGASRVYLAWNGKDLLTLAEGNFSAAPPGFSLLSNHVAASGSHDAVTAAQTQIRSGVTGAPDLLSRAASFAPDHTAWIVAAGDTPLPLSGNYSNLERLLGLTRYTTATLRITDRLDLEGTGQCPGPAQARDLEGKLRALMSLLSAATARHRDLAAIYDSVRISADDHAVHVELHLSAESSQKAIALLAP